ncbi:hypothetical protein LTR94_028765, partial [Friedmanniomyces endolithicus]
AIFGFQGTDPLFFQAAERYFADKAQEVAGDELMPEDERGLPFDRLSLTDSFRSTAPVLEFVDQAIATVGAADFGAAEDIPAHASRVAGPGAVVLCGRFEGFDERLFDARPIEQLSIGDYILSGGEMAALVLLDACVRLLPGVMGAASSGVEESFESGLLEYPHYTRPVEWEGRTIPEVLRSGDHARIAGWRQAQAEIDTRLRRPDLWERHEGARVGSPSGARRRTEDD